MPMSELKAMCEAAGFEKVQTFIASGNVVFESDAPEPAVKSILEDRLRAYCGKPVGALVRTAAEISEVLTSNPFSGAPGNRTVAIFLDEPSPTGALDRVVGQTDETVRLGKREIYVWYGDGMAHSKLRIPGAKAGTARNMNTVAKLAALASERWPESAA